MSSILLSSKISMGISSIGTSTMTRAFLMPILSRAAPFNASRRLAATEMPLFMTYGS